MDETQIVLLVAGAFIAGAPLITWGLGRIPQTRAWIRRYAIEGYNYLDKIKTEVPEAGMPAWQAAYDSLDAIIDAFGDDVITAKELRHISMHGFDLVVEVRKLVA
jgi:hypothetical protein